MHVLFDAYDAFGIFGVLIKHEPTAKQFIHIIVENSILSQSSVRVENLCAFLYKT